jgi:hypothetical protein
MSCLAIGILLACLCAQDPPRRPVPDAAQQKEAEKVVRDIFREEYAKKAPADRAALAKKLLEQAGGAEDASKYVLLREARDLAAAADVALALQAAEILAKTFEVDASDGKASVLSAAASAAKTPEEITVIARAYLRLADEAVSEEDFEGAVKALDAAANQAKRSKEMPLVTRSQARRKDVVQLQERSKAVKKHRETLEKAPDDPAANLAVGQYECFVRGKWEGGLPFLAKATGSPAAALAARDLSNPADAGEKVAIGDGYYQLSEKETGPARDNIRLRALHWYEAAGEGLSGLNKARIDKRIPELRMERFKGTWVDVSDPKAFDQVGKPGDPVVLTSSPGGTTKAAKFTKMPPGDHDGFSVRLRFKDGESPTGVVQYEDRQRCVYIDRKWDQFLMAYIESGSWVNTPTKVELPKREGYVITILLEDGQYIFHVDGKEVARETTAFKRLISLSLQSDRGTTMFDQVKVRRRE